MRQLAASWIHAANADQAYLDWLDWCIPYVTWRLQGLTTMDPQLAPLEMDTLAYDICVAAWEEPRGFAISCGPWSMRCTVPCVPLATR